MSVSRLSRAEAAELTIKTLGLGAAGVDLLSAEGLCASIRRAASFLCPATPRQLVDAVLDAVGPLDEGASVTREDVMDQLELLISSGDLLELRQDGQRIARQIFLGPPSYVTKLPGNYLLLGVRPHGVGLVDDTLASQVLFEGHVRTIELDADTAADQLDAAGLHQIRLEQWLRRPRPQEPSELVEEYRRRLAVARPAGQVDGLTLIDPGSPVHYYRGRWRQPTVSDTGDFVARRPQAYGADLWCLCRIEQGVLRALLDLPIADTAAPGRDEAWRLQAALDAHRGHPQIFRTRTATTGIDVSKVVDLFGPVPGWAERYLELVGLPVLRSNGSLFSYRVPTAAIAGLTQVLTDMLWMRVSEDGGTQ